MNGYVKGLNLQDAMLQCKRVVRLASVKLARAGGIFTGDAMC